MNPINIADYEELALQSLDPLTRDYYRSGAEDEQTLHINRAAFAPIRLRPRVLVDVSSLDLKTTVLGTPISMPILVAPTAYHCLAHPEGECATVKGVGAANTLMTVSTLATQSLEDIAADATGPLWFQLYVYKDRQKSEELVRRAEAAGYQALVLTVDTPVLGQRERDLRNGFGLPTHLRMANFNDHTEEQAHTQQTGASGLAIHAAAMFDQGLTWEAVDWLRSLTALPIVIKGILTAEDARLAVEHGVDGIIVSNHGGRQLDYAMATIEALPEIVAAVQGACEVFLDGGVRRGTDVFKALALGAKAVLVGRPVLWGLAVDGSAGVTHVLEIFRSELERTMALAGCPALDKIDGSFVKLPSCF